MSLLFSVPYTFRKDGIFYLQRYVPADLRRHYRTDRISFSLQTKSPKIAVDLSRSANSKLEMYWHSLRLVDQQVPGSHLLVSCSEGIAGSGVDEAAVGLSFADAGEIYLRLKGKNKPTTFSKAVDRSLGYVQQAIGKRTLNSLTRKDAGKVRDFLVARGLSASSVVRVLTTVKAVVNFAIQEEGLEITNVFSGLYIDRSVGPKERPPIPVDDLHRIQAACRQADDELRWIVAAVSDTGCRLAEIVGLAKADIFLDVDIPYIQIQPHPWRRLKTASSERRIPLVGASLWGIRRAFNSAKAEALFPRYNDGQYANANSASAALSKWLKPHTDPGCTMHSFRHSLRDRLRAVECPSDIADQIGGWARDGVGQGYGKGYQLGLLHTWLSRGVCGDPQSQRPQSQG